MTKPEQPLPAGGHRREVVALIEIEHTTVSAFVVRLLMVFFLAAIAVVPIAEVAVARVRADESIAVAWSHLSSIPGESPLVSRPGRGLERVAAHRLDEPDCADRAERLRARARKRIVHRRDR